MINNPELKAVLARKDSLQAQKTGTREKSNSCVYVEDVTDLALKRLMTHYKLNRICLRREGSEDFDSVITFHREFSPLISPALIVNYDFGQSGWRNKIMKGIKIEDEDNKIINELFLYRVRHKPAFGE